jgi:hypothetical protein
MKKVLSIVLLSFLAVFSLLLIGTKPVKAAGDLDVTFNISPASPSYVNNTVAINFTVNTIPTGTEKIVVSISDIDGTEYPKISWTKSAGEFSEGSPFSERYVWDTKDQKSRAGNHFIYVKTYNAANNLLKFKDTPYVLNAGAIIDVKATENGTDEQGGVIVKIDVTASQLPADSDHINLWISTNSDADDLHLKTTWGLAAIQAGIGGAFNGTYNWNTGENKSVGGYHHIKAELMRANGTYITKGEEDYYLNNDGGDDDGEGGGNWEEKGDNPFDVTKFGFFNPRDVKGAEDIIINIIGLLLSLGGVVAVVSLVYSGIIYLTAGDDSGKTETAKKNITWALIGLAMAAGALLIVQIVANVLK